jgi:hypothetical protein
MKSSALSFSFLAGLLCLCLFTGCRRDMFSQPKSNPLRESGFFPDAAASRPIPPHTISQNNLPPEDSFYTGMIGTNSVTAFPFAVTREVLQRGKQCYEIDCAPCHGLCGNGDGMIVQRGLSPPASFNIERLRSAPAGHFVAVIAQGYGVMFPQASQVAPADRWAMAAYIRALQLSQHAPLAELSKNEANELNATP